MGYALCIGTCGACGQMFGFNPKKVPSLRNGERQEVFCRECCEKANPIRKTNGLPLIFIDQEAWAACVEEELL